MRNRILVSLAAIPVILLAVFERSTNGWPFLAVMMAAAYFSVSEYLDLVGEGFSRYTRIVSVLGTVFMVVSWYGFRVGMGISSGPLILSMPVMAFLPLAALAAGIVIRPTFRSAFRELVLAYFPVIYIGIGFGTLIALRDIHISGRYLVFYAFLTVWLTDSFALFTGKLFGRHRLGLASSPNKTVEGLVGGLFFALVGAVILKLAAPVPLSGTLLYHWPVWLAVTIILGIVGQLGDLTESVLKRSLGVKDSGSSVPGHGGTLDVFDAQLFVSPLLYFMAAFLLSIR